MVLGAKTQLHGAGQPDDRLLCEVPGIQTGMSRGQTVTFGIISATGRDQLGITAYRPASASELETQLAESIGSGELRLIEIPVDPSVNLDLVEKLKRYWRFES